MNNRAVSVYNIRERIAHRHSSGLMILLWGLLQLDYRIVYIN